MSDRPIGYYVHHHGAGHLKRARAIAGAGAASFVLLGTGVGDEGVELADDRQDSDAFDGADAADCRPDALHYAPLDHEGIRLRVASIAHWIMVARPALMVVDVSVEVALLARLASVPVVYVRLNGDRDDPPHREAFRAAAGLLAPFHHHLDRTATPLWIREKTRYFPGITPSPPSPPADAECLVLVVIGRGGQAGDGDRLAEAARSCPHVRWRVIGPCQAPRDLPANLDMPGWVADADREIAQASLVIGAAGDGLVTSILAADRPFICIPEPRPYDEQRATAERLASLGAALVMTEWPEAHRWPALIAQARGLDPQARQRLHDANGARSAADWIARLAAAAAAPARQTA